MNRQTHSAPTGDQLGYRLTAELLDPNGACERLKLSESTLWRLTKRQAIPCVRIGRSVRYCPAELAEWIRAGAPTEPGAAAKIRKSVREGGAR